jgi:hypothetical protein
MRRQTELWTRITGLLRKRQRDHLYRGTETVGIPISPSNEGGLIEVLFQMRPSPRGRIKILLRVRSGIPPRESGYSATNPEAPANFATPSSARPEA